MKKAVLIRFHPDGEAIDLPKYLLKKYKTCSTVALEVYLGKERFKTRLIAYRTPDDIFAQRQRKIKESCRQKGRTVQKNYTEWNKFSFFITNISEADCTPEVLGTIYRLRWDIELIFKTWKSLLNIHIMKGSNGNRVEALLYARMILIVIVSLVYSFIHKHAMEGYDREISFDKLVKWLIYQDILKSFFHCCNEIVFSRELLRNFPLQLCKQKRTRKTTRESISDGDSFMKVGNNELITWSKVC